MAIFKRKSKNKTTSKNYSIRFKDHTGLYHIISGFQTRRATEGLEARINDLVSCKIAGINLDKQTEKWLSQLPQPILKNLVKYGLVDSTRVSGSLSADEHIKQFRQSLVDRGCAKSHIKTIIPRISRVLSECKITNINDLNAEKVSRCICDMDFSDQTRKHYFRNLKQFSLWCYNTGRTNKDLLHMMHIPRVNEIVHKRRALTLDELNRLLEATLNSESVYRGLSGYDRYLIYRFAVETGLRANEISTLVVSDFDFNNHIVRIKPENEKARRGAEIPLEPSLSVLIQKYSSQKLPTAQLFKLSDSTSKMIKKDLIVAGIEYKTDDGFADFHALRHTFGTFLARSGTKPQIAQRLMRHSDPRLTQNLYTHLTVADTASERKFPDLSDVYKEKINVG